MKAIAYQTAHDLNDNVGLSDITLPMPTPQPNDLLVEIRAVSVNPVDTKVRKRASAANDEWKVLGWDAAGVVKAVGENVTDFKIGDHVWYAGDINRQGSNAEFQAVDSRIVSRMPTSLSFVQAAAMPLTTITAWELLFDRIKVDQTCTDAIVIIGAAGGVGSMMIQLLRQFTQLTIIATASRPDTIAWVSELGAHHVINHHQLLSDELNRLGVAEVRYVVSLNSTDQHVAQIAQIIAPQGQFALIDDPIAVDFTLFKRKSVSIHWESMFTRSTFMTPDLAEQGRVLAEVADLVDAGHLRTTMTQELGTINAENIKRAHKWLESGVSIGKVVLAGF